MKRLNLAVCVFAALMAGCCSSGNVGAAGGGNPPPGPAGNPCDSHPGGTNGPGGSPIVCIDFQTFDQTGVQPSPNPIEAHHGDAMQFWFFNLLGASPTLSLTWDSNTQQRILNQNCQGEHCTVVLRPDAAADAKRKYVIKDTVSGRQKDPDILIEP